jgi:hypothetical protein
MAASMRAQAYSDQADAKTLRSIAAALGRGEATYLDGVWNAAQVRTLESILCRAKRGWINEQLKQGGIDRTKHGWSQRYDELEHQPLNVACVRHVTYPKPYLYIAHVRHALAQLANTPSVKQVSAKMRKLVESRPQNQEFIEFVNTYQIELLDNFLSRARAAGYKVWHFDHCLTDYQRLQSMHCEDAHELRMALRELVPHLARVAGDDPVKRAEDELRGRKLDGFFPTPRAIVERMLNVADIQPTHRVLEPSCGSGSILDCLRREYPDVDITAIEQNRTLQGVLTAKGYGDIVRYEDFLEFRDGEFTRVLMNPPFENCADIEHIRHAYDLLAPGGRVVAIASEHGFFARDQRSEDFRSWLDDLGAELEELPDDAFLGADAFRQTGVKTRMIVIDKP